MDKDSSGHKVSITSVRLTADLKKWLQSYAEDQQVSVNAVIKQALEQFRYGMKKS